MFNKITITFATAIFFVVGAIYFTNSSKVEVSASTSDFFQELNVYRKQLGLKEIYENPKLDASSQNKVDEMFQTGKFAHVLPTDKYPKANGYTYLGLGELLAYNFQSEDSVLTGWKNSPSHNDLLIKAGYCEGGFFTETRTVNGNQDSYQVLYLGTPVGGCDPVYASHAGDSVSIVSPSTTTIQSTATAISSVSSSVSTATQTATSSEKIIPQVLNVVTPASSSSVTFAATSTQSASATPVANSVSTTAISKAFTGEFQPIALHDSEKSQSSKSSSSDSSISNMSSSSVSSATNSLAVGAINENIATGTTFSDVIYARLKTLLTNLFFNNPKLFWKIINAKL